MSDELIMHIMKCEVLPHYTIHSIDYTLYSVKCVHNINSSQDFNISFDMLRTLIIRLSLDERISTQHACLKMIDLFPDEFI